MNDLREVVDMQRQMIVRLQREDNYQDARQKVRGRSRVGHVGHNWAAGLKLSQLIGSHRDISYFARFRRRGVHRTVFRYLYKKFNFIPSKMFENQRALFLCAG